MLGTPAGPIFPTMTFPALCTRSTPSSRSTTWPPIPCRSGTSSIRWWPFRSLWRMGRTSRPTTKFSSKALVLGKCRNVADKRAARESFEDLRMKASSWMEARGLGGPTCPPRGRQELLLGQAQVGRSRPVLPLRGWCLGGGKATSWRSSMARWCSRPLSLGPTAPAA